MRPGLNAPRRAALPTAVIESKPFGKDRAGFETALQAVLDQHRIELICLGGFMRLFTPEFTQALVRQDAQHPSIAAAVISRASIRTARRCAQGVKISGATVHFVIPETDAGPILMQGAVGVSDHDTAETLSERILEVEHRIYPDALRLLATGAVQLDGDICKTPDSAGSGNFLISPAASADGNSV